MRKQPGRGQGASGTVGRPAAIRDGRKDYGMDKRLSKIIKNYSYNSVFWTE
jgi:hypothetical protein